MITEAAFNDAWQETACIFHNAYFDIGVMICSAALSLSRRRLHQHAVSQTRRRVTSRRGLCTNLRMTNSQKIITDMQRRKAVLLASGAEFTDVIQKNIYLTLIAAPQKTPTDCYVNALLLDSLTTKYHGKIMFWGQEPW